MTNTEAASLIAILHGAYPGTYFDNAVAEVFTNSLLVSDYETAEQAITDWVKNTERFPTVAEINGAIRRIHERANQRELPRERYEIADKKAAAEAFERGYVRARSEAGDDMDEIRRKLDRHLRAWKLIPATEAEPRERTDSAPKQRVPSRHQPGYLRSSSAPAVDQPAFDASSTDEPW